MNEKFVYDYLLTAGRNFRITEEILGMHKRHILRNAKSIKCVGMGAILIGIGLMNIAMDQQKKLILLEKRVKELEKSAENYSDCETNL